MSFFEFFSTPLGSVIKLPLIALISYLLGSFNTAIVVSKVALKKDIRDFGSGNAGFTNAVRCMGIKPAIIVFFGDIIKCALACLIGQLIYAGNFSYTDGSAGRLLAGAFAFLGHIYPLFFGFRGGKGVITLTITVLFFDWRIYLIGFCIFMLIAFTTKYISLASITIAVYFPIAVFLFSRTNLTELNMAFGYTLVAAGMSTILILKHRGNIKRLLNGTESKFSFHSQPLIEKTKNKNEKE